MPAAVIYEQQNQSRICTTQPSSWHPSGPDSGLHIKVCSFLRLTSLCAIAGGNLVLISTPGYGIDAYLTLQHLKIDWDELQSEAVQVDAEGLL